MQLHREKSQLDRAGGRLVVIGNGAPNFIEGFREKVGFDGELYTDPTLQTYRALRLRRDLASTLNLKTLKRAIRAYGHGHRQSKTQGDPWQQGGVFVVAANGQIVLRYASSHAGDHPPIHRVVAALRRAHEVNPP